MAEPRKADLLITGGTLLCMDEGRRVLAGHSIAIQKGRIVDIFADGNVPYAPLESLDASGCIVMPGLINAHTHLPMTYFRGLADDLPLETWLNEYIWPLEGKLLNSQFIRDSALHGAAEMIQNGITQIHDMYFDMPAIAEACLEAGLRAIIGGAVIETQAAIHASDRPWLEYLLETRQRYTGNALVDFDLAPHSIYVCRRETLEKCAQAASEHGFLLHMHLSETRGEVAECLHQHGRKPVFYLRELGMLDLPAVYAHGIWVDDDEIELLASAPASIAICTECNLKLASGILPLADYLKNGVNVCFATDGVASNNNLDLLAELDLTAKLHKAVNNDPTFLPAEQALRMATIGAAKALGIAARRGSLSIGKDADICVLDTASLAGQPLYNPYSQVVYALGSRAVRDVVIAGELVYRDGRHTRIEEQKLLRDALQYGELIARELRA